MVTSFRKYPIKQRFIVWILTFALMFGLNSSVSAQANYSFQLTKEIVQIYLNKDGSIALDYLFSFENDPDAKPIDFIDLGLPNSDYDFASITADVGGNRVNVTTDYQGSGTGVAIDLGKNLIRQSGTVHAGVGRITNMFFVDSDDQNYASSEFSPTYFGSEFVHGNTDLTVVIHLPPGVQSNEPKYHPARDGWPGAVEPSTGFDAEGRITYTWNSSGANGSSQYTFGASFPKKYIPESAIVTVSFTDIVIGFLGTLVGILPFCCVGLFIFGLPVLSVINERKRKLQYIKPTISIEGHGIKRGLTAVEAAILMGEPLDKVMTMILFSTVKKGALQVIKKDPLTVESTPDQPQTLQLYEADFVQAMTKSTAERRKGLQAMTVGLVKSVTEKMKGFSRKETLDYYKAINEKAWQQIAAAGTPEVKSQMFEDTLEWTMLDKEYDDRARRTFNGPIFMPMWWGRYDPVYRNVGSPQTPSLNMPSIPSGMGGRSALPGADIAASVVGGVQNFSGRVLGNLNDFTSSVTKVTNPVPPPSRSGGHSGGSSCACACAGCACACAGGGR